MNANEWVLYQYRATVTRVVDGDTIQVNLSYGDHTYRDRRIRILGYNAPEIVGVSRSEGMEARAALEAIIPVGSRVYIATQLDRTSFDRLLGTVYIVGAGGVLHDVAQLMIGAGFDRPKEAA